MAKWTVTDELDARVREHVGDGEVNRYVEQIIAGQLDYEETPELRTQLTARTRRGIADAEAGRVRDAREVMRALADKHGLTPPG